MDLRHAGSIALLVLMAVAALFFFPLAHGSFSATHGPITALRASRFRVVLMLAIAAASAGLTAIISALVLVGVVLEYLEIVSEASSFVPAPLRC